MPKLILEGVGGSGYSIGGVPIASSGTAWPTCSSCGSPMQFIAQLPMSVHDDPELRSRELALLIFQCQSDPGMCDEWQPDSGGNSALLSEVSSGKELTVPDGETLLPARSSLEFRDYNDSRCLDTADDSYCEAVDDSAVPVLGKIGGQPLWIQADETPNCSCGSPMLFFAQLECAGGGGINFGDVGSGYAFVCRRCTASAKFLSQC